MDRQHGTGEQVTSATTTAAWVPAPRGSADPAVTAAAQVEWPGSWASRPEQAGGRAQPSATQARPPADGRVPAPATGVHDGSWSAVPAPVSAPAPLGPGWAESVAEPGRPTFSPDGRWYWDGARWQAVEQAGAREGVRAPRRRRGLVVSVVVATVVALVAAVVAAVAIPVYLNQRERGWERAAAAALHDAVVAQENQLAATGRYTDDPRELEAAAGGPLGTGTGADVAVYLLRADSGGYCVAAEVVGTEVTRYVTEHGVVSSAPC